MSDQIKTKSSGFPLIYGQEGNHLQIVGVKDDQTHDELCKLGLDIADSFKVEQVKNAVTLVINFQGNSIEVKGKITKNIMVAPLEIKSVSHDCSGCNGCGGGCH